jgi:excisionase family DNA binding protein
MTQKIAYKVTELAKLLDLHPSTLYREVAQGRIPHYRVGKAIRISVADAEEYLRRIRREAAQDG